LAKKKKPQELKEMQEPLVMVELPQNFGSMTEEQCMAWAAEVHAPIVEMMRKKAE
jgi:hypothetical protein